jgi:hypothetical protein
VYALVKVLIFCIDALKRILSHDVGKMSRRVRGNRGACASVLPTSFTGRLHSTAEPQNHHHGRPSLEIDNVWFQQSLRSVPCWLLAHATAIVQCIAAKRITRCSVPTHMNCDLLPLAQGSREPCV